MDCRSRSSNGRWSAATVIAVLVLLSDFRSAAIFKMVAATMGGLRTRSSTISRGGKANGMASSYPLVRGNGAEPPGLIPTNQIPREGSGYLMDLHPLKRGSGSGGDGTPCGLTSGVLGDLYGSRRLNLVSDAGSESAPPPIDSSGGVQGQDCIGEDQQLREGDRGSGLVWLLGDPKRVPPPPTDKR